MRRNSCTISLDKDPLHTSQNDFVYDPAKTIVGKTGLKRLTFADFCDKCDASNDTITIRPQVKDVIRIMVDKTSNFISRGNEYGRLNRLKTKLPDCVAGFSNARILKANWLGLVDASAITGLHELEKIDLDENNLLMLPDISSMPNLKSLSMKNNPLYQFECGTELADIYGTTTKPKVWGKPSEGLGVMSSEYITFKDDDVATIRKCMQDGTLKYMDQKWGSIMRAGYKTQMSWEERVLAFEAQNPQSPNPVKTPSKYPSQPSSTPVKTTPVYQEPYPKQPSPAPAHSPQEPEQRTPGNVPFPENPERNVTDTIENCKDIIKLYADTITINDIETKKMLADDYRRCNNFFNSENLTNTVAGCQSFISTYKGALRIINDEETKRNFKKCKNFLVKSDP